MSKDPQDLINNPVFLTKQQPDPPVSVAMGHLVTLDGDKLDIVCNVNSATMASAIGIGEIYTDIHGSKYIERRIKLIERLSISKDKGGRLDLIEVVKAGGNLPAEFYQQQDKRTWGPGAGGTNE